MMESEVWRTEGDNAGVRTSFGSRIADGMIKKHAEDQVTWEDGSQWGCDCKTFKERNPQNFDRKEGAVAY